MRSVKKVLDKTLLILRLFVAGDNISYTGQIHWVSKGKICPIL